MQKPHEPDLSKKALSVSELEAPEHSSGSLRRFIRHPSSVPIHFDVIECGRESGSSALVNVSRGGLCFYSDVPLPVGARVRLAIPIDEPPFEVIGVVTWCKMGERQFCIGVEFDSQSAAFSVRMVEQVCYIEHYRQWVFDAEGRELNSEEAALEWVEHYAADFPKH